MLSPIALCIVASVFVVPSPLVAGCGSLLGPAFASVWLRDAEHTAATAVLLLAMALGWFAS